MSNMTMQTLLDAMRLIEQAPKPINPKIFIDDNVCVQRERIQIRFSKRKCHRLVKKFAKYEKNWRTITKEVYYKTPFGIILSSRAKAALLAAERGGE